MAKTSYDNVFRSKTGQIYYEVSLGFDKVTGNRIKKKSSKMANGKKFSTEKEAYAEALRIKNECLQNDGYSDYNITYGQFMENIFIPHYESDVQEGTFSARKPMLKSLVKRFGKKKIRDITV